MFHILLIISCLFESLPFELTLRILFQHGGFDSLETVLGSVLGAAQAREQQPGSCASAVRFIFAASEQPLLDVLVCFPSLNLEDWVAVNCFQQAPYSLVSLHNYSTRWHTTDLHSNSQHEYLAYLESNDGCYSACTLVGFLKQKKADHKHSKKPPRNQLRKYMLPQKVYLNIHIYQHMEFWETVQCPFFLHSSK